MKISLFLIILCFGFVSKSLAAPNDLKLVHFFVTEEFFQKKANVLIITSTNVYPMSIQDSGICESKETKEEIQASLKKILKLEVLPKVTDEYTGKIVDLTKLEGPVCMTSISRDYIDYHTKENFFQAIKRFSPFKIPQQNNISGRLGLMLKSSKYLPDELFWLKSTLAEIQKRTHVLAEVKKLSCEQKIKVEGDDCIYGLFEPYCSTDPTKQLLTQQSVKFINGTATIRIGMFGLKVISRATPEIYDFEVIPDIRSSPGDDSVEHGYLSDNFNSCERTFGTAATCRHNNVVSEIYSARIGYSYNHLSYYSEVREFSCRIDYE